MGQKGPGILIGKRKGLARQPKVRANPFRKIFQGFEIGATGHGSGLVSRFNEALQRFEPMISPSLNLGHPLRQSRFLVK